MQDEAKITEMKNKDIELKGEIRKIITNTGLTTDGMVNELAQAENERRKAGNRSWTFYVGILCVICFYGGLNFGRHEKPESQKPNYFESCSNDTTPQGKIIKQQQQFEQDYLLKEVQSRLTKDLHYMPKFKGCYVEWVQVQGMIDSLHFEAVK